MTKKIAIFSNGLKDEYKGKRDVKAAWLVTYPNGGTESGHSYDRQAAAKTAASHISANSPGHYPSKKVAAQSAWWNKIARDNGFTSVAKLIAVRKAENAAFASACRVEIVDVVEA